MMGILESEGDARGHALELDQLIARAVGRHQRAGVLEVLANAPLAHEVVRLAVPATMTGCDERRLAKGC
eukprot:6690094-Prymnesium_polylepis.1